MNCSQYHVLIAQSLDGETDPSLQDHFAACPACRQLQSEMLADREALGGLEEIPELALSELRNRVMGRIPASRPKRLRLWLMLAGAAAAAVVIAVLLLPGTPNSPQLPQSPQPVVARAVPPVDPPPTPPPPQPRPPVRAPVRRPTRINIPEHQQPLMVKLETSDPNVVIYWTVEGNNGELE